MFYVRVKNNVKIAVYDLNCNADKAIVMIHGWPLSAKIFEYQRRVLADCGYRVVTLDLRGFGCSDVPADGYCYDQFADDIYHVVRSMNLPPFILVGFSMGGAIALRYMKCFHCYGVKKLALLAAAAPRYTQAPDFPCGVPVESVNELILQAKTDRAQLSEDFSHKLLASPHSDAIKGWFRDISLEASGIGTVRSACALRDEDGRRDLECVHVPAGIFHGKKDQVVPYELGLLQHKSIPGSRMFTFEESGHGVFYDELEQFNKSFLDFLKD